MKKMCGLSTSTCLGCKIDRNDRLSLLPDDILLMIISLLNITDAVRTSTLSQRWKKVYAYKPRLEFDWREIISNAANTYAPGNVSIRNVRYFQRSIEAVLASYLGTKIESFKVQCCFGNEHPRYFKGWINFAVRKGVENLDLSFTCDKNIQSRDNLIWESIDYYDFPTQLLLNGEASTLRHLSLRTCKLRSDTYLDRFSTLVTLQLCDVKFAGDVEGRPRMFSRCSNLECLTMEWCFGLQKLCIGSSLRRLRTLEVSMCKDLKEIELISVANLTTFRCKADSVKLTVGKLPTLKEVHVMMKRMNVLEVFHKLEKVVNPRHKASTLAVVKSDD